MQCGYERPYRRRMFSSSVTLPGPQSRVLVDFSSIKCLLLHVLCWDKFSLVCSSNRHLSNIFYVHDTSLVPMKALKKSTTLRSIMNSILCTLTYYCGNNYKLQMGGKRFFNLQRQKLCRWSLEDVRERLHCQVSWHVWMPLEGSCLNLSKLISFVP